MVERVFLLSPANCSGKRANLLKKADSPNELACRLRSRTGAELGDVFAFVSSLYFRGKLAYARVFARAADSLAPILIITPGDGLRPPETLVRRDDLLRYAAIPIDRDEARYREPLERDVRALAARWGDAGIEVVLLGSIASDKYADLLITVLGERLLFPETFVGRGDMSRGGLLLRCAREGKELDYVPLIGARRRGSRPAKLPPLRKGRPSLQTNVP